MTYPRSFDHYVFLNYIHINFADSDLVTPEIVCIPSFFSEIGIIVYTITFMLLFKSAKENKKNIVSKVDIKKIYLSCLRLIHFLQFNFAK